MKLFSGKITKYKFILLSVFSLVEIISFIFLFNSYKPLYLKVFEQSLEVAKEKALSITNNLNEIIKLSFIRYIQDLKFIGKHMSLLSYNNINKNSHFYQNIINNQEKQIYCGTNEELKKYFGEYYDNKEGKFLYFEKYINYYINNITNKINLLPELMNNEIHPELNSISYYKFNGSINDINNNKLKKISTQYLILMLKTNYIKKFVIKGSKYEIIHFFLLTKDEIYFYPPDSYNNSVILPISKIIGCKNNIFECFYNYTFLNMTENIINKEDVKGYIFPVIPFTYLDYEMVTVILCLNIPFEQKLNLNDLSNNPLMCMEINGTQIFSDKLFREKDAFNFIFFVHMDNDIVPVYSDKTELYEDIKRTFNNSKFENYSLSNFGFNHFILFHFLYFDLFNGSFPLKKYGININDIFEEYKIIKQKILTEMENIKKLGDKEDDEYFKIHIKKTICKSDIYFNDRKCMKDDFLLMIYPLKSDFNVIDIYFIENKNKTTKQIIFYSMSILNNNYIYIKWKINTIIVFKILKLFIFYFLSSICLIFLFFAFVQLFFEFNYNTINQILLIIKGGALFEMKEKNEIIKRKEEILTEPCNKDMLEIQNLFEYIIKTILLIINFEQNCNNKKRDLPEKSGVNNKKQIDNNTNNKNISSDRNNIFELKEYMDLIYNINNKEIILMFSFIITYLHFKKGLYKLSENEFKNLIIEMNSYLVKVSNQNEYNDSKLKDSISRSSRISYLNEYSLTNELSETTISIIKLKLLAQKIYYLYALSIFNQEKQKANNDKKYNKENAKIRYEEAIKYFNECKNISILLGTDTIRQIFSLIMISKCNNELKNYKESMINLNEALLLYSDLQKAFKDKPYFNPKITMFTENYIFQNIMLSIAQTTFIFNKYPESCWILMKIIETSPFVFNSIHFQTCFLLCNCLTQIEGSKLIPYRQIDKYKKRIYKAFARINVRLFNKIKKINSDSKSNSNNLMSFSATNSQMNNLSNSLDNTVMTSNLKKLTKNKDMSTTKLSVSISSLNHLSRNKFKNITLCISERLIQKINEDELKDVILKFFKKCFAGCIEGDKFCFIQFSYNGKKTISIKSDSLEIFLQKLESNKMAFKLNDDYTQKNEQILFMEFANLLLSIIKSNKTTNAEDRNDNIIIIFINTSEIRFNGQQECVDTINELNNNNYTVIIFTYDTEIDEEKIDGIYSFVYGLNDGHFFQIKNYQQIKQVFMNIGVKDSQEKFNNYNYEITDYML